MLWPALWMRPGVWFSYSDPRVFSLFFFVFFFNLRDVPCASAFAAREASLKEQAEAKNK